MRYTLIGFVKIIHDYYCALLLMNLCSVDSMYYALLIVTEILFVQYFSIHWAIISKFILYDTVYCWLYPASL